MAADFRRGPIKRSKLHPKAKVKSFQSPQLFGPQNGAELSRQETRTEAALFVQQGFYPTVLEKLLISLTFYLDSNLIKLKNLSELTRK